MNHVVEDPAVAPVEALLDPFSFLADVASRIEGLGGGIAGNDRSYAFHTPYVEAAPGPCNFTVRFSGLAAKHGTLQLRVHMIPLEAGAVAMMVNMDRIALNRLVQHGGEFSLRFEGFKGYGFALMGLIPGDTDARADGLVVALDRPGRPDSQEASSDGRPTAYGRDATAPVPDLLSTEPPSFASPVTQICTRAQLRDPVFAEWRRHLDRPSVDNLTIWREAFVLQALRRYGMLTAGARGLALGVRCTALPETLARAGTDIMLAVAPGETIAGGEDGAFAWCDLALDPFPKHLVDYDFAFSTGLLTRTGSPEARMRLFEQSMGCLRPHGLMIHTAPMDLALDGIHLRASDEACGRNDIERMALVAISRNHEVAQFKIEHADAALDAARPGDIGAFGIILRRAASIL